mgnify:CR=1 FL=1
MKEDLLNILEGELFYGVDDGVMPVNETSDSITKIPAFTGNIDSRVMRINNGREWDEPFDIDIHGFELVSGFRAITIYAHLSHINKNIKPGTIIKAGDVIGNSGNSGTRESTLGLKSGAHLHWEMILQKGKQEIYLGKDVPNPQLYAMLRRIFYKASS